MKPETTKQSGHTPVAHVPGPWRTINWGETIAIRSEACDGIAHVNCTGNANAGIASAQDKANAKLIAAAPELLEACQAALPQVERFNSKDPNGETCENPVIAILRAAIAKAKGTK